MTFDINAFDAATVSLPTKRIPVPQLKDFFEDGEPVEWEIKALSGLELAVVEEWAQKEKMETMKNLFEAIAANSVDKMKVGFEELFNPNVDENGEAMLPQHYLKCLKKFELASVPACPSHVAVKIAKFFPNPFYTIVREIDVLSAAGPDLGK